MTCTLKPSRSPQNAKRFTLNILDSGMLNWDAFIWRPQINVRLSILSLSVIKKKKFPPKKIDKQMFLN